MNRIFKFGFVLLILWVFRSFSLAWLESEWLLGAHHTPDDGSILGFS